MSSILLDYLVDDTNQDGTADGAGDRAMNFKKHRVEFLLKLFLNFALLPSVHKHFEV
jgi:hypothetical protein